MGKSIDRDSVLGLPIICQMTGKKLGFVKDIVYESQNKMILGILGNTIGYKAAEFFIPFKKIIAFGEVAIIVEKDPIGDKIKEYNNTIVGMTILSDDGQEVGEVRNIIFNPQDGQIKGYEISKGMVDDLVGGRNILSGSLPSYSNGDVIVIPLEQSMDMKSNNRGIINILSSSKFQQY